MAEFDDSQILRISVLVSAAFLEFHRIALDPPAYGSDLWTLTLDSTEYLGRPECTMTGPGEAYSSPFRKVTLPAERIEPILRKISRLVLPSSPPFTGGLDGDSFTVRLERGQTHVEYHWWSDVPAAWEPLGAIVDEVLSLADEPEWPRCRAVSDPA